VPKVQHNPQLRTDKNPKHISSLPTHHPESKSNESERHTEIPTHEKEKTLNQELYRCHLQAAQEWGKCWNCIQEYIIYRVNTDMEKNYKTMDDKIRLIQTTTRKQKTDVSFHPRVINNSNIEFCEEELSLLNKSLKYNLAREPKSWINNLAFEAEAAITMLPSSEQDYTRHQVAKNLGRLYQQQRQQNTHNSTKE